MDAIKRYWDGFTVGVRILLAFMAFAVGSLIYAAITGQLQSQPIRVDIANPAADASRMVANDAMNRCESEIYKMATNRSSVKFVSPFPVQRVRQMTDGNFEVNAKFSAKNGYGSESVSLAKCVISADGHTLIEITSQDSM